MVKIGLARAIYRDLDLPILDEATHHDFRILVKIGNKKNIFAKPINRISLMTITDVKIRLSTLRSL